MLTCCCTLLHAAGRGRPGECQETVGPAGGSNASRSAVSDSYPSRRYQAAYIGPDLALHRPAATFETLMDARAWLTAERRLIDAGAWTPPSERNRPAKVETLRSFAVAWLADPPLKPSTRDLYARRLREDILPPLGDIPLKDITPATVRQWYTKLDPEHPTRRAHSYGLLRTILGSAVSDDLIPANPAHIRGAGMSKRVHKIKPATLAELETLTANFHRVSSLWCCCVLVRAACG